MLILAALTVAVLALGAVHWRLSRMSTPLLGAVFPLVWLVAVVALVASGRVRSGVEFAGVALVAVALLRIWGEGRSARAPQVETG